MTTKSTDYAVRVRFETILGNFEKNIKSAINRFSKIGTAGKKAGSEASQGFDSMTKAAKETEKAFKDTGSTAEKMGSMVKKALAGAAAAYVGKKVIDFGISAAAEYGKTQKALGEMSSLGYEDLETLKKAAVDFSNQWSGTTRDEFISAAYDIKSGIASLSDEGVAEFTKLAGLTAKATKASIDQMTSLFATGYGIYRDFYNSDEEFGEAFAAGIAQSVQSFKTDGGEMAASIESLGAAASSAGVPLEEQLSILGMLQSTMSGSEAGTKYNAFLQSAASAGDKLNLAFLDSNNQLKSMPEILDMIKGKYGETIDATEKLEIGEAFGTDEAVQLIDLLYNKTGDLRNNMDTVAYATENGVDAVEDMASKMNNDLLSKIITIKQNWSNLLDEIGKQMEPALSPVLDEIIAKLRQMQESGDFTALGQSIGSLVQAGSQLFTQLLDKAPGAISALASAIQFLADNFDTIIFAVKTFLTLWAGFKVASGVLKGIQFLTTAFKTLTSGVLSFKNIFLVIKGLLKTNIFGLIISAIISVIMWFVNLTSGIESWRDKFTVAMLDIQIKFQKFVSFLLKLVQKFIGFFSSSLAGSINGILVDLDNSIAAAQARIDGIKAQANSAVRFDGQKILEESQNFLNKVIKVGENNSNSDNTPAPSQSSAATPKVSAGGGYSGGKAEKRTIEDDINDIEDKHSKDLENVRIKADLAEGENNKEEAAKYREQEKTILQNQVDDFIKLEEKATGENKTIVETARLKTLKELQDKNDIAYNINNIDEEYADDLENVQLKADLADKQKNKKEAKSYKQQKIEILKKQADDLLELEEKATGQSKTIAENARLKILQEILDTADAIRKGINDLAGEFNTPSNITAMKEYEYMIKNGNTVESKAYGDNNVEMYFSINNPESLTEDRLKNYFSKWARSGLNILGIDKGLDPFRDLAHADGRK